MTSARLGVHRLPLLRELVRAPGVAPHRVGHGHALGDNGRGSSVLLDVHAGVVSAFDPATGARTDEVKLPCAQDPLTPGLVAVDDTGRRALVMSSRSLHGDSSLVCVDLDAHTAEPVHTFEGPGWVVGAFSKRSFAICEQRLGDAATFRVLRHGRTVWSVAGMQQPCVPAFIDEDLLALVVCPAPDPMTLTGPSSLCALDLVHGTLAPLAPADGTRVRVLEDELVVDGGAETVRARFVRS